MPLFSGKAVYPPGKRVLDEESSFSDLGIKTHHDLEPIVHSIFQNRVICKEKVAGSFGTSRRRDIWCWESALHCGDPWITDLSHVTFKYDLNSGVFSSEILNHSIDLLH